jgi:phosphate transport system permease protein
MSERWIERSLFACALFCALMVSAVFGFLLYFSLPLFTDAAGLAGVLSMAWKPFQGSYGILPMIAGTFCLTVPALLLSYPLAIGVSCFAHGLAPARIAKTVMAMVYFMTSIPTVIYGFVSVFVLVPFFRQSFDRGTGFCLIAASLTLAILILPTIVLSLESELGQRSEEIGMAAKSLGLTPAQELLWVLLPCSGKGLVTAAVLGFGRAVGDTLVALMVAGNAPLIPHSLLDPIRALTSHIALVVATDSQDLAYYSIFAAGLMLFVIIACLTVFIRFLAKELATAEARSPNEAR